MEKYIEISGRKIGIDYDPVVIAEMGINPGGSLEVAKSMVDSAYEAGIEIIKHQTHTPEEEEEHTRESDTFTEEEELELKLYVESKGMIFISAPYCFTAVDRLERMNVAAYKISSSQIGNTPLVEYVASKGKPVILSAAIEDTPCLKKAIETVKKYHDKFIIQHCTSIYPTPLDKINLTTLDELREMYPGEIVGISDHSLNNFPCYAALALGASVVERHFTDKKDRPGVEIAWSMDKDEAKELVSYAKSIKIMKNAPKRSKELENKKTMVALATSKRLIKNSTLTKADIITKLVEEEGIPSDELYTIMWKKCVRDLPEGHVIKREDIK